MGSSIIDLVVVLLRRGGLGQLLLLGLVRSLELCIVLVEALLVWQWWRLDVITSWKRLERVSEAQRHAAMEMRAGDSRGKGVWTPTGAEAVGSGVAVVVLGRVVVGRVRDRCDRGVLARTLITSGHRKMWAGRPHAGVRGSSSRGAEGGSSSWGA